MHLLDSLMTEVSKLELASPTESTNFSLRKSALLDYVDHSFLALPQLESLISPFNIPLMRANHVNHHLFIASLLHSQKYKLLIKTLPWVYRTYKARGFSYDYFSMELKFWKLAIEKILDPSTYQNIIALYDFMLAIHEKIVVLSQSDEDFLYDITKNPSAKQQEFLSLLQKGEQSDLLNYIAKEITSVENLGDFFCEIVPYALYTIGKLWELNKISVAQEHLASSLVYRCISALPIESLRLQKNVHKTALVTAAPNEMHEIGARMVADSLTLNGWSVSYLGANTPAQDLLDFLQKKRPFLLAISTTTLFNYENTHSLVASIRNLRMDYTIKIILGGMLFNCLPELEDRIACDSVAKDSNSAVAIADNLWMAR